MSDSNIGWILKAGAVMVMAAVAIVVASSVASDVAEDVSGSDARRTAAAVAALSVEESSRTAVDAAHFADWDAWGRHFTQACERIAIIYSDAGVTATPNFAGSTDAMSAAEVASASRDGGGSVPTAACLVEAS